MIPKIELYGVSSRILAFFSFQHLVVGFYI
jgi:hypothetical protein